MSQDYSLLGQFPFDDLPATAVATAATALGVQVTSGSLGDPRIQVDGLLVYSVEPDEEDRSLTQESFGFENNLTLVFVDYSHGDSAMLIRVRQNIMKVTQFFSDIPQVRAVLIADYEDDAFLASVEDGRLVLNQDYWTPWEAGAEVLAVIPEPHELESLHLLNKGRPL